MEKKRIWHTLCNIALILVLLVGIFFWVGELITPEAIEDDRYRIYEKDGVSYICVKKPERGQTGDNTSCCVFDSVEELQNTFLYGFPEDADMNQVVLGGDRENGTLTSPSVDFRKPYDAILPDSIEIQGIACHSWKCQFIGKDDITGYMELETSFFISGYVDSYWEHYHNPALLDIHSDQYDIVVQDISDRNAREVIFKDKKSGKTKTRYLFYTLYGPRGRIYVEEYGSKIVLVGEDQGADFKCTLIKLSERPSVEYLKSFGLKFRLDLWKPFAY